MLYATEPQLFVLAELQFFRQNSCSLRESCSCGTQCHRSCSSVICV
uniref:Uncharacterized protein n=1 Tax=Arundo donax TaxID=35708 RepID=A0A0A9I5R6_ARUDO